MASKAIMRTHKHRSKASVGGMGKHMNRAEETPNADPARRDLNRTWSVEHGWRSWAESPPVEGSQQAALDARLEAFREAGGKVQKNAVQVVELFLGASPEAFAQEGFDLDRWAQAQIDWLHETFGKGNVLEAVLHLDETTPHVHAMVFPQIMRAEKRGGARRGEGGVKEAPERPAKPVLSASHWLDGGKRLSALQTDYARAMEPFGLERGQERSRAKHQTVRQFYGALERIERAAQIRGDVVSRAIERLPEPRLFSTPAQRDEQRERQLKLAEVATKLRRIAQGREQQALDLRQRLEALQGRYQGLQDLVGGVEAVDALEMATRALEEVVERHAKERAELQQALAELRSGAARDREALRSAMQADIDHWRQHAGELQGRVDALEIKQQEVREWGRRWKGRYEALEGELYGPEEGPAGPRMG